MTKSSVAIVAQAINGPSGPPVETATLHSPLPPGGPGARPSSFEDGGSGPFPARIGGYYVLDRFLAGPGANGSFMIPLT